MEDTKDTNWWEKYNAEANWEALYEAYPDVDWNEFYSKLPKELLPKEDSYDGAGA